MPRIHAPFLALVATSLMGLCTWAAVALMEGDMMAWMENNRPIQH